MVEVILFTEPSNLKNLLTAFKHYNLIVPADCEYLNELIEACHRTQNDKYSDTSELKMAERVLKWINKEGFKNIENKNA